MHQVALLQAEVSSLRSANEALSKRRKAKKKTRVRLGGSLTVQDGIDLLDQKDVDEQVKKEERQNGSRRGNTRAGVRHCSNCGKPGHNCRTCQRDGEITALSDSNVILEDK